MGPPFTLGNFRVMSLQILGRWCQQLPSLTTTGGCSQDSSS